MELYHRECSDIDSGYKQFVRSRMLPLTLIHRFCKEDPSEDMKKIEGKLQKVVKDIDAFRYRNSKEVMVDIVKIFENEQVGIKEFNIVSKYTESFRKYLSEITDIIKSKSNYWV